MKNSYTALLLIMGLCRSSLGSDQNLEKLANTLKANPPTIIFKTIHVHSPKILKFLKTEYSPSDLKNLTQVLKPATEIRIHKNGLVQAADLPHDGTGRNTLDDPTHYDAIWLRDTLWVHLGLRAQGRKAIAKKVLLKMFDYLSSKDQLERFKKVIANPEIISGPNGAMEVVHIRFDGGSPTFQDVQIKGQPQKWNHKQNDALGLFYDLALRNIKNGTIDPTELNESRYEVLVLLPAYFAKIKFYEMEDAGSWEEIEKVNTSSVGLVTSSLENLARTLEVREAKTLDFVEGLNKTAEKLNLKDYLKVSMLDELIDLGYKRIFSQLDKGGESPPIRMADAALLNLIYPAQLSRLSKEKKIDILNLVRPLIGEVGIKRYLQDSYQSGNFWFHAGDTDDTSSSKDFENRGKKFIENSEAQWFFDSWYSTCAGLLSQKEAQLLHFTRALAQITGEKDVIGADGKKVPAFAFPESYNTIVYGKSRYFAPSPITPLNWAKASMLISLEELKGNLVK
jgi:hypothetical protein